MHIHYRNVQIYQRYKYFFEENRYVKDLKIFHLKIFLYLNTRHIINVNVLKATNRLNLYMSAFTNEHIYENLITLLKK